MTSSDETQKDAKPCIDDQTPTSPGWWWLDDITLRPVHVFMSGGLLAFRPNGDDGAAYLVSGTGFKWDGGRCISEHALVAMTQERNEAQQAVCWRAAHGRPGHEGEHDYDTTADAAREFGWDCYPAKAVKPDGNAVESPPK